MSNLNIVDENENIIGVDSRENIHKNGLLHREIHVWFYTPKDEIIFQLRSKNKDTFPNLLDATVGGHVELGSDYISTALKEMEEETGIKAQPKDLKLITKFHKNVNDPATGLINNALRTYFAYKYDGNLKDLKVEEKDGQGFEAWNVDKLYSNLSEAEKKRFIPSLVEPEYIEIYKQIREIFKNSQKMTNYEFLKKYQQLQYGIMYDELFDLDFVTIGYSKTEKSSFWNLALTNNLLKDSQLLEVEDKFKSLKRNSAIYFENKSELKDLTIFLENKGYKKSFEDTWQFWKGEAIDNKHFE